MKNYLLKFSLLLFFYLFNNGVAFSDINTEKFTSLFDKIKNESDHLLNQSLKSFSTIVNEIEETLDEEIQSLKNITKNKTEIDIQEKMDSIRLYLDKVNKLKKKEVSASTFTIISESKKDYRIKIDQVLKDIEPILFDGEVVNYASRIRLVRQNIKNFENEKVKLNEKFVFAPEIGTLLKSSKKDIKKEIKKLDKLIQKSKSVINELEYDLKRKMNNLGIKLTREQIKVMTTRIDGDDLARSFAIFDVTKQISETLSKIMKENAFSGMATVKYYGTYVILSEILGFNQRQYINKIEDIYLPAIDEIKDNIENSIEFAEDSVEKAKSNQSKKILLSNIKSNQFTLEVLKQYKLILVNQIKSLNDALKRTNEQITVAYSTYDTAANSANLVNLINQTQDTFNKIMNMQLPGIIPFENIELEEKFQEISNQLVKSMAS